MPQAHEIFTLMPETKALEILACLHESEQPLYRATIATLAQQRNVRPVFIERKPKKEQFAWLLSLLTRKANLQLAIQVLQIWLIRQRQPMLCDFLDGFGIPHDENGTVESLPAAPAKPEVVRVVESLLAKYDPTEVAIYLHTFQTLDDAGWSSLGEVLGEDPRLQLRQPAS
jgi:hypothetical protein